ncbi:MAG: hypothetical protein AAB250_04715 [Bdellovibrionota bacterium]
MKSSVLRQIAREPHVIHVDDANSMFEAMTATIAAPDLKEAIDGPLRAMPVGRRYFSESGKERAWVFLDTLDIKRVLELKEKTKSLCPGNICALEGDIVAFSEYSRSLVQTLFSSFLLSLVLVGLTLTACAKARGKMGQLPAILLSSSWAPFAVLFTIWVFEIEVNFVTSIVLSVLVGLTGDNAIQYIFAGDDLDAGARAKGRATLICSLTMIGVSLLFVFAPFEPTKLLGLLLALGFALVFIGDYSLLRGLLTAKRPTKGA